MYIYLFKIFILQAYTHSHRWKWKTDKFSKRSHLLVHSAKLQQLGLELELGIQSVSHRNDRNPVTWISQDLHEWEAGVRGWSQESKPNTPVWEVPGGLKS